MAGNGRELTRLGYEHFVLAASFSPDGSRIVTASWDKTARIWDVASGHELARLGHKDKVQAAAFSLDGLRIVTVSDDNAAHIWDAISGQELARLGHDGAVWAASFSPDGTRIVTGSWDETARVWDAANGRELVRLRHDGVVSAASFSQDGARIVTASQEARVWDTNSGRELARLSSGGVRVAAFSPDTSAGLRIVTASGKEARLWRVEHSTQQLVDAAKQRVARCLRQSQRAQFFLPAAPPIWCITGAGLEAEKDSAKWQPKWPYQPAAWRDWLVARQRGEDRPVPGEN